MRLFTFFRSGTSHRLRIALNLKGLDYESVVIDLRREEHLRPSYAAINPQRLVPALEDGDHVFTQTPAIIEWLEERYPSPPLLPSGLQERAQVRALAAVVGCDIHPLNNRRVLETLRNRFGADEAAVNEWCGAWISSGFDAYVALMERSGVSGRFSFGEQPTLADVYLIPQIESARRFKIDLGKWPRLQAIDSACAGIPGFAQAHPVRQPDAS